MYALIQVTTYAGWQRQAESSELADGVAPTRRMSRVLEQVPALPVRRSVHEPYAAPEE